MSSNVGVDWLQGTVANDRLVAAADWLCEKHGSDPVRRRGRHLYTDSLQWPSGAALLFHEFKSTAAAANHGDRGCVVLPGGFCSYVETGELLIESVFGWSMQATRIDVRFDDAERRVLPMADIYPQRHLIVGRRTVKPHCRDRKGVALEDSVTVGDRATNDGVYVRIYDKELESAGRNKAIRWEAEYKGKRARAVALRLAVGAAGGSRGGSVRINGVPCLPNLARDVGGFVGSSIDFGLGRGARRKRPDWWVELRREMSVVPVALPQRPSDIERTKEWIMRCAVPAIAKVSAVEGDDFGAAVQWSASVHEFRPETEAAIEWERAIS